MNTIQPSKTKTLWILQANGWTWEYHPEWGNQSQKDTQCALTYKCILAIKYRIPMLHSTNPKKLNKKEGPSEGAWISFRRVNKIVIRGRCGRNEGGREDGEAMRGFQDQVWGRTGDGHENEWKSATCWVEEAGVISRMRQRPGIREALKNQWEWP